MTERFELSLSLRDGYAFTADFGPELPSLVLDEAPPLGAGEGPNPARLLATAVGGCLSASLLFCLRKSRIEVQQLRTIVETSLVRNEHGRLRIGGIKVRLAPDIVPEQRARLGRCLELFEDFCIVTESVRAGVAVDVSVEPSTAEVTV